MDKMCKCIPHNPFIFVCSTGRHFPTKHENTKWAWGAVDAWIDEGIGESRVLCVLAEAGTGKSTISVAIWEKVKIQPN